MTADTTRTREVVSLHADNDPTTQQPKRVIEVARRCDKETVSRNIFSATQKISTKTGGSKIQMDLGVLRTKKGRSRRLWVSHKHAKCLLQVAVFVSVETASLGKNQ